MGQLIQLHPRGEARQWSQDPVTETEPHVTWDASQQTGPYFLIFNDAGWLDHDAGTVQTECRAEGSRFRLHWRFLRQRSHRMTLSLLVQHDRFADTRARRLMPFIEEGGQMAILKIGDMVFKKGEVLVTIRPSQDGWRIDFTVLAPKKPEAGSRVVLAWEPRLVDSRIYVHLSWPVYR